MHIDPQPNAHVLDLLEEVIGGMLGELKHLPATHFTRHRSRQIGADQPLKDFDRNAAECMVGTVVKEVGDAEVLAHRIIQAYAIQYDEVRVRLDAWVRA